MSTSEKMLKGSCYDRILLKEGGKDLISVFYLNSSLIGGMVMFPVP